MAEVHDRRKNFYSSTQAVKDEAAAPRQVESAGDELLRELSQRQLRRDATVAEHLAAPERFQRGLDLEPCLLEGVASVQDLQRHVARVDTAGGSGEGEELTLDGLRRKTGMTRHELEIVLSEKPNSGVSKLYKFALNNKRKTKKSDKLESQTSDHPINHLKEIEEEYFGSLKRNPEEEEVIQENNLSGNLNEGGNESGVLRKKRKRQRKRRKKTAGGDLNIETRETGSGESSGEASEEAGAAGVAPSGDLPRPSLWDVRDMRSFCRDQPRVYQCQPPPTTLYTVREGRIVKLGDQDTQPESPNG